MENENLKPSIRFPEFTKKWKPNVLDEQENISFLKGKGISKVDIVDDGITECIRYGELYTIYDEVIDKISSRTNLSNNELVFSKANDVIIPASGETQIDIATASCVLRDGIALSGDLNIIRSEINGVFLSYYLNNKKKKSIARLAQGSSVIHLYNPHLKTLKLNLPEPEEQQKIADFLTSIETRISSLKEKKDTLLDFKKGVLQKIFSQEIRFKNDKGSDFPDWEEKKANEIFKNHTNKKHIGDLPILSASQEEGMIYRQDSGKNIQASIKSIKSYKIVEPNDFVITLRSFQGGIDFSNKKGICSPAYTILKNCIPISYSFYKFYFKKERFINRLNNTTIGIRDGKQITYDNFGNMLIPYPKREEQTKIANYLTALDDKIDAIQQKIDASVAFKKGLLQKMFV